MRARMLCYECVKEGKDGFMRWGDTTTGGDTHGLCPKHFSQILAQAGMEGEEYVEVGEQRR